MNKESERVKYVLQNWSHLQLAREYEKLENIMKEVREYIEKIPNEDNSTESQKIAGTYVIRNVILEILDKGDKGEQNGK